jgi:dolichol-phosphate mannosyltransferase
MARAIRGESLNGPARMMRFGVVGLTGIVVNQALFVVLTGLGLHYVAAAILSTQGSTTWNFFLLDRWAMAGRADGSAARRLVGYAVINNATLLLRIPVLWMFVGVLGIHENVSNLISLAILFIVRFGISDRWVWGAASVAESYAEPGSQMHPAVPVMVAAKAEPRYRYDIAGVLRVHSEVELPELAYFRTETIGESDLNITVGSVGGWPARRIRFNPDGDNLSYTEHLGRLGASFDIKLGQPSEIVASPLLARSRHVLYTNVVEAMLRFMLVDRGYVLLHSGCVAKDGRATLLSAQTDTGKTSTVIRLVRDFGYSFLSDDMTIVSPTGMAISYPKPMTLSFHTMATIAGAQLGAAHRAKLSVQSRVHSKSGRTIGRGLGSLNVPIMAINSATQIAVPPPKYHITSLLDTEIQPRARIEQVVFIERGGDTRERVDLRPAIDLLIENTDDAYGFPPFATIAPHLNFGAASYEELRARERALLAQAVAGRDIWRLRVPGHGWAELIPELDQAAGASSPERPVVSIPVEPLPQPVQDQGELVRGIN